jgi:Ni/Fe-hydrogenase subunit HybB-like protein
MVIRKTFVYTFTFDKYSIAYLIEIVLGIIVPLIMFNFRKVTNSVAGLFTGASLVIFGVLANRINTFIVAYNPPYATKVYFPSFGEISVTIGCIALMVMLYRAFVIIFPVISLTKPKEVK